MFDTVRPLPAIVPLASGDTTERRPALSRCDTVAESPSSKRRTSSNPPGGPIEVENPVVVVAPDRTSQTPLARAVLRQGWAVHVAHDGVAVSEAATDVAPRALVLTERTAIELPRPLSNFLRSHPNTPVVVHGCAKALLGEGVVRALGAKHVIGLEGSSVADIVTALVALLA